MSSHWPDPEFVLRQLLRTRDAGELRGATVASAAQALGVSRATLYRWMREGRVPTRERSRYELSDRATQLFFEHRGNVSAMRRALVRDDLEAPSRATLARAVRREFSRGARGYVREGAGAWRKYELTLRWEPANRNDIWEADHKELAVLVIPPRHKHPVRPWVTLFLDAATRAVMGWSLSLRPTSAEVLAALRMAILEAPGDGPFCGVPDVIRWDNGLEFVANAISEAVVALSVHAYPTRPWTPQHKGKVERFNRTLSTSFLSSLPFCADGPRSLDGRLYGPEGGVMTLERFVAEFKSWVWTYNNELPHSALSGRTPLARWEEDPEPLRHIAAEELRWMLLKHQGALVRTQGIRFRTLDFIAPELNPIVGERVEIGYMPHDLRSVEVFYEGRWICTAKPQGVVDARERERIVEIRREERRQAEREMRRLSRRQRVRFAPITADGEIEETTTIGREEALSETNVYSERKARREARLTLPGLLDGINEAQDGEEDQ